MKAFKNIIGFILILALFVGAMGCKLSIDPDIQDIIYEEAGYFLTYEGLKNESASVRDRIEKDINKILDGANDETPVDMVTIVTTYIKNNIKSKDNPPVQRALRLLPKIIKIDMSTPKGLDKAKSAIKHFLEGALDGIKDLN